MRELTFVGLSSDGRHLLLVAQNAGEYLLRIDDRLASALRREGERLRGQPTDLGPMPTNPTPREIQERIRAGMSVNAIAAAAGVGEESIARFATAVLAERAFIADQARESTIRFEDRTVSLGKAVVERLTPGGIEASTVRWDAWRRADGDWTVVCAYPFDRGERIATFGFDPTARRVWPD
ncbi:MAG: septation protein SepH, partial [Candidatus Nanopelagicales bacterium]|nr:septation protein SepH [Candidatus Nanopelagicales bacterium]